MQFQRNVGPVDVRTHHTARRIRLVVAAALLSSALAACKSDQHNGSPKPNPPIDDSDVFVDVDPETLYANAPQIRAGRRVFEFSERRVGDPGDMLYSGGATNSVVVMGMTTKFVVSSANVMTRTIWNGQLHDGSVRIGSGNLEGSIEFLPGNGGELYVEAQSATSPPPSGSTPYAWGFPIVVTTSGGVRAGSVGTAWFVWCKEDFLGDDEYWFVLLDNPPSPTAGTLYVAKGACWGGTGGPCVRRELTTTDQCIRVCGTVIEGPMPITEPGLQEKIDEAKTRAVAAGLRTPTP